MHTFLKYEAEHFWMNGWMCVRCELEIWKCELLKINGTQCCCAFQKYIYNRQNVCVCALNLVLDAKFEMHNICKSDKNFARVEGLFSMLVNVETSAKSHSAYENTFTINGVGELKFYETNLTSECRIKCIRDTHRSFTC